MMGKMLKIVLIKIYYFIWKVGLCSVLKLKLYRDKKKCPPFANVLWSKDYQGGPILLIALYEKGHLRKDIVSLLEIAKAQGFYTLSVNTQTLSKKSEYEQLIDCYIERDNYGRDFGSYKAGFEHIYKSGLDHRCSRLLMVNDSVFYSKKNCALFLGNLVNTDIEVLGATENYDEEHHLGSFCISIANRILISDELKCYWHNYKCPNLRPDVISQGEMKLSRVLKKIAGAEDGFQALYNTAYVARKLEQNPDLIPFLYCLSRKSKNIPWPAFSWNKVIDNSIPLSAILNSGNKKGYLQDRSTLDDLLPRDSKIEIDRGFLLREIMDVSVSEFLECFNNGSQLHANNIFLHYLGVAIIKLDGLYRGVFDSGDIETIAAQLDDDQKGEFRRLMYSRPYGAKVLRGWKRHAFNLGIL